MACFIIAFSCINSTKLSQSMLYGVIGVPLRGEVFIGQQLRSLSPLRFWGRVPYFSRLPVWSHNRAVDPIYCKTRRITTVMHWRFADTHFARVVYINYAVWSRDTTTKTETWTWSAISRSVGRRYWRRPPSEACAARRVVQAFRGPCSKLYVLSSYRVTSPSAADAHEKIIAPIGDRLRTSRVGGDCAPPG